MTLRTDTPLEFIKEWFGKAAESATRQNRKDSAALWRDGLAHLEHMEALIAKQQALLERARTDLKDIADHAVPPFAGQKWLNYARDVAESSLKELNAELQ